MSHIFPNKTSLQEIVRYLISNEIQIEVVK